MKINLLIQNCAHKLLKTHSVLRLFHSIKPPLASMVRSIRFRNTRIVRTTSLLSKLARTSVILAFRDSFLLWGCLPVFTSCSQTTRKKSHGLRGRPGDLRSELFQVLRRPSLGLVGIVGQCSILLEHNDALQQRFQFMAWPQSLLLKCRNLRSYIDP